MEWVEVRGKSVDVAVAAALVELGLERAEQAEIEVLQEPEKGFLGLGGRDAIVRVKPRPARKRRRRRRKGGQEGKGGQESNSTQARERRQGSEKKRGGKGDERRSGGGGRAAKANGKGSKGSRESSQGAGSSKQGGAGEGSAREERKKKKEAPAMPIEEQAPVVEGFLEGLVKAFGLEGEVTVTVDGEVIVADVRGPQTEAMVGPRGKVIEAIHELTKTVLQRQTQSSARLRLDVAGYGERRRQALSIYAGQLIDQVVEEGGEVVLEPMSAGDRKVIHDAVGAREGVKSYSEGEAPRRYVVIAATESGDSGEEE